MRKLIAMILTIAGVAALAGVAPASAQEAPTVYAVKFVCGTQRPVAGIAAPVEPPVKPGNYATVINIEALPGLSTDPLGEVSVAGSTLIGLFTTLPFANEYQTIDITCTDIVRMAGKAAGSATFITGYYNIRTTSPLSVSAVYSSQGCTFLLPGATALPPFCSGPTSIDVVPQQPVIFPRVAPAS